MLQLALGRGGGALQGRGATIKRNEAYIVITFVGEPDPREVRAKLGMSHEDFAAALCITVDDLMRWEQGHRDRNSPAARLLWIAEHHPDVFLASATRTNAR